MPNDDACVPCVKESYPIMIRSGSNTVDMFRTDQSHKGLRVRVAAKTLYNDLSQQPIFAIALGCAAWAI
jgi:hypothetical protein